jgi:hypothetical protein
MSDGLFYGMALVVVFLVWLAGGGVHRPISFSGPFISPIVNESSTQTGYGPALGGKISAGGVTVGTHVPTTGASNVSTSNFSQGSTVSGIPQAIKATSPYAGKIYLAPYVNGTDGTNPANEYLSLTVSADNTAPINVTGWQIRSIVTGAGATIPNGISGLALGQVTLSPIMLQPNSTATLFTTASPVNVSYEENSCSTYLATQANYSACYAAKSGTAGFLTNKWQIYLNHPQSRLWKNSGDTIELLDASGRVVDSFSY